MSRIHHKLPIKVSWIVSNSSRRDDDDDTDENDDNNEAEELPNYVDNNKERYNNQLEEDVGQWTKTRKTMTY